MKKLERDLYQCNRCGTCCSWRGYVRLKNNEADNIAEFLKIPVQDFIERYTYLTEDRQNLSVIDKENGRCFFLQEDNTCQINPVKPQQCKDFPFVWRFFGWRNSCQMSRKHQDLPSKT